MADVNININARNNAKAAIQSLTADVNKMVSAVGAKMQQMGASISGAGKKLAGIGLAGTAALGGMTRTFAGFDDAMAKVSALSGATGDDLLALRDKAKELGSTTKFSATQAAEGMNYLAMAGFDTNEILAGIPATLSLAAAGGLELAEAADIASDVGTMFGMSADEIARVSDVLAATATSANTSVSMMGESFKYFGASANLAGQSIEESSAALAVLASSGMKASQAGTSLNQLFTAMVKGKEKFRGLGVEIANTDGTMRPLLDVMKDVGVAMEDMTEEERLTWFSDLGARAGRSAAILAGAPKENIESFRDTMNNAAGSAERMAETMQTGVGGAGVKIMSAFEGMQIAIVEQLKPALLIAADAMVRFFQAVTEYANNNPQVVKAFAAFSIGLTALGGTLVAIGGSVSALGVIVSGLGTAFGAVGAVVAAVFTPMGAAITAVVGLLVYAVYASGAWKDMFEALKKIATETFAIIQQTFQGLKNALAVGDAGMAMKIVFAGLKLAFVKALAGMFAAAREVLPKIWNIFKSVFAKIAQFATDVMNAVIEAVKNPTKAMEAYEKIKALFKSDKGFGELGQQFLDGLAESAQAEFDQLNAIADMKARTAGMTGGATVGDAAKGVAKMVGMDTAVGAAPKTVQEMAGALGMGPLPAGMEGLPAMPDAGAALAELQGQSNSIQGDMKSALDEIKKNTAAMANNPHIEDKYEFDVNEGVGAIN